MPSTGLCCLLVASMSHFTNAFKSSRSSTSLIRAAKSSSPLSPCALKYSMLSFSQLPSSPACVHQNRVYRKGWDGMTYPWNGNTVLSGRDHRVKDDEQQLLRCPRVLRLVDLELPLPLVFALLLCDLSHALLAHLSLPNYLEYRTLSPLTTSHHASSILVASLSKSAFVRLSDVLTMARMRLVALVRVLAAM